MTFRGSLLGALSAGLVLCNTGVAWACGDTPLPNFAFSTPRQAAGDAGVAGESTISRDEPIVVALSCSYAQGTSPVIVAAGCSGNAPGPAEASLVVRPVSELGSAMAAPVAGRFFSRHDALVFLPSAPLQANTSYYVEATLPASMGSTTPRTLTRMLRTSDALLPAFVSATPARVVPEWYDAPVTRCDGLTLQRQAALAALEPPLCLPAGANCRADGSVRALRFHAQLGPLSGGATALPYEAQLNVAVGGGSPFPETGAAPADLPGTGQLQNAAYAQVSSGLASLYLDAIKPDDLSQKLCVRARAYDAAGHVIVVPEQCATYVEWMTDAEWPDEAADRTRGADAGAGSSINPEALLPPDPAAPTSSDDGCSVQHTGDNTRSLSMLLLSLGALVLRRKRRVATRGRV